MGCAWVEGKTANNSPDWWLILSSLNQPAYLNNRQVTICQKCGDEGLSVALIYCDKCQTSAEHRYCLDILPETFNEYVTWFCDDCVPKVAEPALEKACSIPSRKSDSVKLKTVRLTHRRTILNKMKARIRAKKKKKGVTGPLTKTEVPRCESSPCLQSCEMYHNENCEEDQKVVKQRRLIPKDGGDPDDEAESSKFNTFQISTGDPSNISEHNHYVPAQPIIDPVWRGSFSICNENFSTVDGLVAHLSSKACLKVSEEASLLPEFLCPDMLPRSDVWPKSFESSGPRDDHIALYFFPGNERDEKVFDSLVECMVDQDLAMRAVAEHAELLVFTSMQLPLAFWRFRAKLYLWGVFRGKQAFPSHKAEGHLLGHNGSNESAVHLNSSNDVAPGEGKDLKKTMTWNRRSPLSPLSNSGSYGSASLHSPCVMICHLNFNLLASHNPPPPPKKNHFILFFLNLMVVWPDNAK